MPIDESAALAAVNAGIAEAASAPAPAPTPEPTPTPDTGGDDAHVDTEGAAGETPAVDGAGDAAGGEGAPADAGGDEAADGKPDGGDGVPADGDEPSADAKKEGVGAEAGAEARKPDPLNDPLPNALKKETKERINTLISMVKENTTKLQEVVRDRDDLLSAIVETKATPGQYGQALEYLRMVNGTREDREKALSFMQQEIAALARMLGKPVPGVNMLEGHQDLIDEVSTGRLSPERAQEIAAARSAAQFQQRESAANANHERQTQAQQQARAHGVQSLNRLGAQLKAQDGAVYEAKRKVLVESLRPVFAKIPPNEWAATFKRAYDNLTVAAPTPPPPPRPTIPTNTPLRATQPAGGTAPAPKSLAEAIDLGISQAG